MASLIEPALPAGWMAAMDQPSLEAGGVSLRPWQPSDVPAVVAAYADPAIQRWHGKTMTDDEAREWIDSGTFWWRNEVGAGWAVVDGAEVLGQVGLRRVSLFEGRAEVSYWTLPAARGRRVAPRALVAMTTWCFETLRLHRIELNHSTLNTASCRVAQQAGYPGEGTKRGELRHPDGWHDMHAHARLVTDPPMLHSGDSPTS